MTNLKKRPNRSATWLRWGGRTIGTLVAGFWLFTGVAHAVTEPFDWQIESVVLTALILISALSTLIAWRRERLGGFLLLGTGIGHSLFAAFATGHNLGLAMLITGGPFILTGALFLESWHLSGESERG